MDGPDATDRYTSEVLAAISAAIARDPRVAACRERARAAGLELRIDLQAEAIPAAAAARCGSAGPAELVSSAPAKKAGACEITDADRRFLRSLRIKT